MPVTARLSKKFYERLGEDIAQELVDWFNQVDATYRSDLRELNELNFARFDAKLEQRISELEAKLNRRIDGLEASLNGRIDALEATLDRRMDALEANVNQQLAEFRTELATVKGEMIRWMFVFWIGTVGTMLATVQFLG